MKSKFLTVLLALIPGVGQLYLGLMQRGVQLLVLFFGSLFLIELTGLYSAIILLPIIWFISFFDALEMYEQNRHGLAEDRPLLQWGMTGHHQHWVAYGLIGIGAYLIVERLFRFLFGYLGSWIPFHEFRTLLAAVILIFIGWRLLRRSPLVWKDGSETKPPHQDDWAEKKSQQELRPTDQDESPEERRQDHE